MRYLIFLFLLLFSLSLPAQQAIRQVIGSIGGSPSVSGTTMSFTVGEAQIGSYQANSGAAIKGFQRPIQVIIPQRMGDPKLSDLKNPLLSELYPNPALDKAFLHYQAENATVSMTNAEGKIIWKKPLELKEDILSLPIDNLPEGMYFVTLRTATSTSTHKLIIAR